MVKDPDADRLPTAEPADEEKTPVDPVPGFSGLRARFLENLEAVRAAAATLHAEIEKEIAELEHDFDATVVPLLEKGLAPDTLLWQRIDDLFTFALGREVGQAAVTKAVGREMHRQMALAIERHFPKDLERFHEFLAIHWAEAGNHGRALHYCLTALDNARRVKDLDRVASLWHRTVKAFQQAIDAYRAAGEIKEVALLQWRVGLLHQGREDTGAAVRSFTEAQATYTTLDDRPGIATCLSSIGMAKRAAGDADGAIEAHAQALNVRRSLGDKKKIALTLNNLGVAKAAQGDSEGAIKAFDEAALTFREAGDPAGQKLAKQHASQLKKDREKERERAKRRAGRAAEADAAAAEASGAEEPGRGDGDAPEEA